MPVLDASTRSAALARALGGFSLGVAALGALTLLGLPLPAATDRGAMLVLILGAAALGAGLIAGARVLPVWAAQGALGLATAAVSLDIAASAGSTVNDEMLYLLPACCALLFCSRRSALLQLAAIPAGYAAALVVTGDPEGVTRWVIATGVLAAVAAVVQTLATRLHVDAAALVAGEERFRSAFDEAHTGMALGRLDGTWIRVNRSLAGFLGYDSPADVEGMTFRQVAHPDEVAESERALARLKAGELAVYRNERRYLRRDGSVVWGLLSASVVRDAAGAPCRYIAHIQDISDRKAVEAELAHRAGHDALTGLPTRELLLDRIGGALARLERRAGFVSLLFLDLDRFKLVNDSYGHQAGDQVVVAAADRLRALLRPEDTLSRLGGDEFLVLCESSGPAAATRVADRIVAALGEPFDVAGRRVFLATSIGITQTDDPGAEPGVMLAEADAAMYRAKELGGARHAAYTPELRARGVERLELDADLRRALEGDEVEVLYQPEIDLTSGRVCGVEALARWHHPQRGLLLPEDFIGPAEESGLIVPLGARVLREACEQARRWQDAGHSLRVSVNLSARQLADPALGLIVRSALADAGLSPSALRLEITEAALTDDVEVATEALDELAALGVSVAIDDFGVGFSPLNRLRRLEPVDVLKIDRSFVGELGTRAQSGAIIAGIVGIAHMLGLTTVAEGIETAEQAAGARDLGCDQAQGFHFAVPATAADLDALLAVTGDGALLV